MVSLPRLSPRAEHRILKASCGLGPRAARRIFGAPPGLDGQTLASDAHALIRLARVAGDTTLIAGMTVEEAREATRRRTAAAAARAPTQMARVEQLEVPGAAAPLPARHYVPEGLAEEAPLLVFLHGGGWVLGDLDTHDGVCRLLAAGAGVAVLSVAYRPAPEDPFPAAVEDVFAAFRWTAAHAPALGADPARIAIGGDSAGGNLAAAVSILARDAGAAMPAMQLLLYPATDAVGGQRSRELFADGFLLTKADLDVCEAHYLPPGTDRADPRVSVLRAPDLRGLPPAYVATAGFDPLRDEGEAYGLRMREAGVPVVLRRHQSLIHAFANQAAISPGSAAAMTAAAEALRAGLAQRPCTHSVSPL
ncbi:MAG TPA: alpha/beta hydrolase [Solirubrobacterales bacterium]|nr:alpha/beta hydrolase [Solirubrobacterales bacterium]